jgi:enoyl-CoA hydratase
VVTVILDRPARRNAVDAAAAEALARAFREFECDPGARVAVLWGAGGTFCAGADLTALDGLLARLAAGGDGPLGPTGLLLAKPVIAAIAGHAVAGGLELALWCDLRVVEATATLGVFNRRWGVPLVDGGTFRLPRVVGLGRALDLVLTGRPVDAAEAERIGLATRVVPAGQARPAAEALARELAALPQAGLLGDRRACYETWGLDLPAAVARERDIGRATLAAGEALRGAARFVAGEGRHGR